MQLVVGSYWKQRYLVRNPATGNLQFMDKQWNRVHRQWENYGQRNDWETQCATCHATGHRLVAGADRGPASQSVCTAAEAYDWSNGRALFASGSPFEPVRLDGRVFVPRQGNNSYIFPGVGLGAIASGATRITDEMFMAAAHALARDVSEADLAQGSLYPPLASIREVSAHIAAIVARVAYEQKLATVPEPDDLLCFVKSRMYEP